MGCISYRSILEQGVRKAGPSSPHLEVNGASLRGPSSEAELMQPFGICQGGQGSTDYKSLRFILYMGYVVPKHELPLL